VPQGVSFDPYYDAFLQFVGASSTSAASFASANRRSIRPGQCRVTSGNRYKAFFWFTEYTSVN
jgi:hypothetical protein